MDQHRIVQKTSTGDAPEFDTYIPPFKTPKKLKKVGINLNSSAVWDIADLPVSEMGDYARQRGHQNHQVR